MNQQQDLQKMKYFYELFPYPNRSIFAFPSRKSSFLAHGAFSYWAGCGDSEKVKSLWQNNRLRMPLKNEILKLKMDETFGVGKKILLVGCGTDEPLLFRVLHPLSDITGIDLSEINLLRARRKLMAYEVLGRLFSTFSKFSIKGWFSELGATRLLCGDALQILGANDVELYDHVQCFGVLHHQPNPRAFFQQLVESLKFGATVRIMIYSKTGRRLERRIQNRYSIIWNRFFSAKKTIKGAFYLRFEHFLLRLWQVRNFFLTTQPASFRFRYLGLNSNSVADAMLHPSDPGLEPQQVVDWAYEMGLVLAFCEARIDSEGWVAGFENVSQIWAKISAAEGRGDVLSNIILVFKKVQKRSSV